MVLVKVNCEDSEGITLFSVAVVSRSTRSLTGDATAALTLPKSKVVAKETSAYIANGIDGIFMMMVVRGL
jgi:hypothetical protein